MNAATYVINTAMSPHLVEWYTDIYTHIYGIDTTYTDVLSQFNTYLKQMINSANFTTFSNMILTIGIVLMLFHFFWRFNRKGSNEAIVLVTNGKIVLFVNFRDFYTVSYKTDFYFL